MATLTATTLGSTTFEATLLELLGEIVALQNDAAKNPNNFQMVTAFSRDHLTGIITASIIMASVTTEVADTGVPMVVATEVYL